VGSLYEEKDRGSTLVRMGWRWGRAVVGGDSMTPTLQPGDQVLVRYGVRPRTGDVVVVQLPGRPLGVKRLIRRTGTGWWIEGDAADSTDSRTFGSVLDEAVLGRVRWRYWPLVRRPLLRCRAADRT
jgi:nickel-type superoxide dismutase maturation protease